MKIRSSKKQKKYSSYTTTDLANFPFIDPTFLPDTEMTGTICTIPAQTAVLDIIQRHFHLHPLIPVDKNGRFLNVDEIWKRSVREMYEMMIIPGYGITSTFRGILRIAGSCGQEVVIQKYLLVKPT